MGLLRRGVRPQCLRRVLAMRSRIAAIAFCLLLAPVSGKRGGGGYSRGGGGHSYPSSTGYSGAGTQTHSYPQSTGGSGHGTYGKDQASSTYGRNNAYGNNFKQPRTDVHHHYHYSPPQQINYGSAHYPTYRGSPPTYVYHYRESGSRFDTLLTGLALYNLAMMTSHHGHSYNHGMSDRRPSGEQCKLGVKKETGEYEENRVDCRLLTSLMLDADSETQINTVTKTVTTITVFDAEMAPDTTHGNDTHANVTTVTVTEAVAVKGPSIAVTPGMQCYLIHTTYSSTRKKIVPCGLLQTYAVNSMRRSDAITSVPSAGLIALVGSLLLSL